MSELKYQRGFKKRVEASKTVCSAFYNHTNIRADGNAYACCRGDVPIVKVTNDLANILHTKEYDELRKKSERGEKISGCAKCYFEEEKGQFSMRQRFNTKHPADKVELKWIEMYANNICNLTCIMCWDEFSSAIWAKENPGRPPKEGTKALKSIPKIPETVRKIRFMGGEPFMTSTHRKILQTMKDSNLRETYIEYTTNGTFMLGPDDHALLSRAKQVTIDISIDAFGGLNSIVREGADWEKIDRFIDDLIENTKYKVGIYTTLHNKGWKNLDKLAKWVHSKKMKADNMRSLYWMINPLTYPNHLCISHLPSDEKEQLIKWVEEYDTMFVESSKHYIKSILNIGK
tara:strand:+ start:901 stop:1935 length:1035 start_codon:yes stop_codon:yes gene_type:complete